MPYQLVDGNERIKAWIDGVPVEHAALQQLRNVAALPIIHGHIAVMPDVHWGNGATVGSVIPTLQAIVPAAVGVDVGCGLSAIRTSLTSHQLPENLREVRAQIERDVPVGFSAHDIDRIPEVAADAWAALRNGHDAIREAHPEIKLKHNPLCQMGTLGGGNHFIELCLDEADRVWIMLHSGSRGIGNRIGNHFIEVAKREIDRLGVKLPDNNLAWLAEETDAFDDYVRAVLWAQEYARLNRATMMTIICDALRRKITGFGVTDEVVSCHHNYVQREVHFGEEVWLTRKGAVSARSGEFGIVPGSMGTKSFIVRGKGNPDSFCSCSHGAGRAMSRGAAKKAFTVNDLAAATAGVECRKDHGVLDEAPGAYKDVDAVISAQSDLVEVVHTLKQVLCVKG